MKVEKREASPIRGASFIRALADVGLVPAETSGIRISANYDGLVEVELRYFDNGDLLDSIKTMGTLEGEPCGV